MPALEGAQAEVALKYDPQQANIQRQLDALKAQTASNEAGLNEYGVKGREGIGDVYNTLNSLLTANRAQSAQEQATAGTQIGNIYDFGAQTQNAVANAARQRMADVARQLGGATNPGGELEVLSPFETENLRWSGYNQQAKANALENQKGWATRWDQLLGQGINQGEQARAQRLSEFETELLNQLGANKVTGLEGENAMYGRLGDIMQARQNDLIASFERLQQQEWERSFQQAQLDQDAAAKNASLAMQKYGIDAQSADAAASRAAAGQLTEKDLAMLAQQAGQDAESKRRWEAEFGMKREDMSNAQRAYADQQYAAMLAPGQELLGNYMQDDHTSGDISNYIDQLFRSGMPTQRGIVQNNIWNNPSSTWQSLVNNSRGISPSTSYGSSSNNSGYGTPSGKTRGLGWFGFSG
jgi:hypothetical protein